MTEHAPVAIHELDEIDWRAVDHAEHYCVEHAEEILHNPAESMTRLFDMLTETYGRRMICQRIMHGSESIEAVYIATRTPDTSAIDELYSEYTVYDNSSLYKTSRVSIQKSVTMFEATGGWRRIILTDGMLRATGHKGVELNRDETNDAVMDFAWRTNQAIATYSGRTTIEQQAANDDARDKLRSLGIYDHSYRAGSSGRIGRAAVGSTGSG